MNLQRAKVYGQAYSWLISLYEAIGNTTDYDGNLYALRGTLKNGGLSLSDIGISEKEIEELRVKACSRSAEMWLDSLRNKPSGGYRHNDGAAYLFHLREELKNGGLSLSDIGTDEKELASFILVPA
mgnify:CR=1 FL=1